MNQVEEVLFKTQDIPSIPFDGTLYYKGIKINFNVLGKVQNDSTILYSNEYNRNHPNEKDEFENARDFGIVKVNYSQDKEDMIESVDIENPVTDITNIPSRKNCNSENYIAYKYNNEIYIVEPFYQFVYAVKPENSPSKYDCIEKNEYEDIPDSVPQSKIEGSFKNGSNNAVIMESSTLIGKVFNLGGLTIPLEFTDVVDSYYDKYELVNNNHGIEPTKNNTVDYSPATVSINKDVFVIKSEFNDTEIYFNIPLENTGALPEWVNERIDVSMLLSLIDSDKVLMANIEKTDKPTSRWSSNSDKYELKSLD